MSRIGLIAVFMLSGCFVAPNETLLGHHAGGGAAGGTVSMTGGGTGGGGTGPQTEDGDATCDQSTCLPATGDFGALTVAHLAQDAQHLYALVGRPTEYTGGLVRIEKATGAWRVLYRDENNPIDPNVALLVRGAHVYFGKTWAGEIWGMLARVPLAGGPFEELFDSSLGGGNPHKLVYDVVGSQVVFAAGSTVYKGPLPATMTTRTTLCAASGAVRDLAVSGTTVFFSDDTGVHRADLATGALQGEVTGSFTRIFADSEGVLALRNDGAIVQVDGIDPIDVVGTFVGASDFTRANGKLYAVKPEVGSNSQIVDSSGVLFETAHHPMGMVAYARLAVDATHLYLGTNKSLAWKSTAVPSASCGCAPTVPVIPAETQACNRNVCGTKVRFSRPMQSGTVDGTYLWGVFLDSNFSSRELVRYTLNGGGGVVFPGSQLIATLGVEADAIWWLASPGDLGKSDKMGDTSVTLVTDVRTWPNVGPYAALDATHAYYLSSDGIHRIAKSGGTPQPVTADTAATALHLDDTHVWFLSEGRLSRAPKTGGAPERMVEDFISEVGFGLSGAHVYFLTARGIERKRKSGGFKTLVVPAPKLGELPMTGISVQVSDLMVTTSTHQGASSGALWRLKLADGSRQKLLQLDPGYSVYGELIDAKGYALSSWKDTLWVERGCSCPAP